MVNDKKPKLWKVTCSHNRWSLEKPAPDWHSFILAHTPIEAIELSRYNEIMERYDDVNEMQITATMLAPLENLIGLTKPEEGCDS